MAGKVVNEAVIVSKPKLILRYLSSNFDTGDNGLNFDIGTGPI